MKNLGASVYDQLTKLSKASSRPFQELLLYYAMERFLARLAKSKSKNELILKGALMLHVLSPDLARATRDIDFLGSFKNDLDEAAERVRQICSVEIEDGILFELEKINVVRIKEDADYEGVRVSFYAKIGSARIPIQLDMGFGDAVTPAAFVGAYPQLLNEDTFSLKMYPRETIVAEKLEAMVKLDMINSRMKDFFDIWFLSRSFEFDGGTLQKAIQATFKRRGTDLVEIPMGLTETFWVNAQKLTQWRAFRKRLNVFAPEQLADVGIEISKFLFPVLMSIKLKNEFKKTWSEAQWK